MDLMNYIVIRQKDGYVTKLTQFLCPKHPKASILILHGMAEHQKRYFAFAKYLTEQDFDVYLYDHRGHGTDKKLSDLGLFALDRGDQLVVEDAINISSYIEQNNRSHKFFLMGHSMGSLIARNVIQSYDRYQGVILSGTANPPKLLTATGLILSSAIVKLKGKKHISPYLNNLTVSGKRYTRLCDRTAFDWLSRSHTIVGAYINDPYCGFICTASFYHDLIKLTSDAANKKYIKQTKKDLPLLIISGEKDPVGGYGKDVNRYVSALKQSGFTNITLRLYPECRHELLNELNNEVIYNDIYLWLTKGNK